MRIHDFNPANGQAFQGDVSIIPIPAGIAVSTKNEIKPFDNKLILQEGELTGHQHHITIRQRNFRPTQADNIDPVLHVRDTKLRKAFGAGAKKTSAGTAHMYRDPAVVQAMQERGILTRADLAVGCLVVEGAPIVIAHQEHDGIRVPPGNYLIGRQVESAGAEERVVAD